MKRTKKGITLVELVVCCGILVMLAGACTAVLVSGARLFSDSSDAANTQIESNALQTFLLNRLPSAKQVISVDAAGAAATTEGTSLYFDAADKLIIRNTGENTEIRGVADFTYSIVKAGDSSSDTARAQLQYTVKMSDGSNFSGGVVLGNVKYDDTAMGSLVDCDLKTDPLHLSSLDVP